VLVLRALCLIAMLECVALAGPTDGTGSGGTNRDQNGAVTPWIDLAPNDVLARHSDPHDDNFLGGREDHRLRAAVELGSFYTGFAIWAYFAWYRNHPPLSNYKFGGDGMFGVETYAGGADKLGHTWATMSLARMGTAILTEGGWDHTRSTLLSAGLSELLFLNVEIRDGFYFEFSFGDLSMDTVGMAMAILLDLWPRLDEMFDFRVQYWPSSAYLKKLDGSSPCPAGGCSRWNIAEDYSGQTYLLAFHLSSIHALRDMEYGTWSRFVDVALGFDTRNYKPPPDPTDMVKPTQQMFIGVSLNAQGILDYLLEGHTSETARKTRKVTHGLFEVFNLPFTSLPVLEHDHSPTGTVMGGGA
jgi:predicted lipoprotein DUF2279